MSKNCNSVIGNPVCKQKNRDRYAYIIIYSILSGIVGYKTVLYTQGYQCELFLIHGLNRDLLNESFHVCDNRHS